MANRFPKTVAACRQTERSMWDIGDALLEEAGPPPSASVKNGSYVAMDEVVEELEEAGCDTALFSVSWLAMLRTTAWNFPVSKRRAKISFSVHRIAKTPEILGEIVAHLKIGTKLTSHYVERVMQHQRDKENRRAEREWEKKLAEKEAARQELKAAEERKRRARSQKEKEEAMREVKAARDQVKSIPDVMPKPDYSKVEPPTKQDMMVVDLGVMAKTDEAIQLGEEVLEVVEQHADKLDDVTVNAFVEGALECANLWRKIADTARKYKANKRGHLAAV